MIQYIRFDSLKGKVVTKISRLTPGSQEVVFVLKDKTFCILRCACGDDKDAAVEEVTGNVDDLIDTEILEAEKDVFEDGYIRTLYKLTTAKGTVNILCKSECKQYLVY